VTGVGYAVMKNITINIIQVGRNEIILIVRKGFMHPHSGIVASRAAAGIFDCCS